MVYYNAFIKCEYPSENSKKFANVDNLSYNYVSVDASRKCILNVHATRNCDKNS